jgi:hypothetical protein
LNSVFLQTNTEMGEPMRRLGNSRFCYADPHALK